MKIYRAVLFAGWAAGTVFWGSEALARGFLPDSEIPQKEMRERISVINPGSEVTNRNLPEQIRSQASRCCFRNSGQVPYVLY